MYCNHLEEYVNYRLIKTAYSSALITKSYSCMMEEKVLKMRSLFLIGCNFLGKRRQCRNFRCV